MNMLDGAYLAENPTISNSTTPVSILQVYDFPQWAKHRSQYRLIDRLLQLPQSHILQNILPSIAWCSSIAALVTAYMYAYDSNILPDGFPALSPNAACSSFVNTTVRPRYCTIMM